MGALLGLVAVWGCVAAGGSVRSIEARDTASLGYDETPRGLGLVYELYVRSFQDSDADGIGDLEGARRRLGHVASLGVETIWLMPILESPSPAGYDVTDFEALRAEYGSVEDLERLVDDAHAAGMRVLLDLPLNHTSTSHPWFVAANARAGSPDRARYVFSDTQWDALRWHRSASEGWYYGFFGAELPDLDWSDALTRARMLRAFSGWLDVVDGYRLDAVVTLVEDADAITDTPDTHALLAELMAEARAVDPDARILAEASVEDPTAQASYLGGPAAPEADRVIDFARRPALLAALAAGDPGPLLAHLRDQEAADVLGRTSPFLQSHDVRRLPAFVPDARARRAMQVLQLTLPGDPILYYGEELDLADATTATGQDYAWRAPMPWDGGHAGGFTEAAIPWFTLDPAYAEGVNVEAAAADPDSMLRLIQSLAPLRPRLADASWSPVDVGAPAVVAYTRDQGRLLVVVNLSPAPVSAELDGAWIDVSSGRGREGVVALDAYGYAILHR